MASSRGMEERGGRMTDFRPGDKIKIIFKIIEVDEDKNCYIQNKSGNIGTWISKEEMDGYQKPKQH